MYLVRESRRAHFGRRQRELSESNGIQQIGFAHVSTGHYPPDSIQPTSQTLHHFFGPLSRPQPLADFIRELELHSSTKVKLRRG